MGKHLEEKSLIAVNENSLFYKIKSFFLKLFRGKKNALNGFSIIPVEKNEIQSDKRKDDFIESIRNVENEQTKLLKLQEQFDNRKIEKSQLSKEQIADLTALYKKQINDLEQSNERRINKIRQNKNGVWSEKRGYFGSVEKVSSPSKVERYDIIDVVKVKRKI